MQDKEIELNMSNISHTPIDLLHRVTSAKSTVWANPFNSGKYLSDQLSSYRKYKNYFSNMLYMEIEPYKQSYKELLDRAIKDKKLVFECTCFPGPCHMDVIRERLTKDLEEKGFKIKSNHVPFVYHNKQEDE